MFRFLYRQHVEPAVRTREGSSDFVQEFWLDILVKRSGSWQDIPSDMLIHYFREAAQNLIRSIRRRHHAKKRDVRREAELAQQAG
jgi:hypothetical protein